MRKNKFLYELKVVIDKPTLEYEEPEEESVFDMLIPGKSLPGDVKNVVNYIARAEYNNALEKEIYSIGWDKKVGVNTHVNYCLPGIDMEYPEKTMSKQHIDKIFRWVINLDTDEEKDVTLRFYILHRDMFGDIKNLHREPIEQKLTLYHSDIEL